MKIHRGPLSNDQTTVTDEKTASEIGEEWEPGAVLYFDGTIDKSGERHTSIGIEIEEADAVALATVLLKNYKSEWQRTKREREAFQKIVNLSFKISEAPSSESFAGALRAIVNYYDPVTFDETTKPPDLEWVAWGAI